jgi:hypothetical protein
MQEKAGLGFLFETFVVVIVLGILAAVAIPNIGGLIHKSKTGSYDSELREIQTALTGMLSDSRSGSLLPVGPTADMSRVKSNDATPLVLADYLLYLEGNSVRSGCTYIFSADGSVIQIPP